MLILFYLVFLCSNFLFIKSDDNGNITIDVKPGENCVTNLGHYTLIDGLDVTLVVKSPMHINHGWCRLNSPTGSKELFSHLSTDLPQDKPILQTHLVDKSMDGEWEFKFYYNKDDKYFNQLPITYENHTYIESICTTKVRVVSPKTTDNQNNKIIIIITSVVCAIAFIIIIAQAVYIVLLKKKAQRLITLNRHNNLSKKMDPAPSDTARYCSSPRQKTMKVTTPVDDDNHDSVIYDAPNIELPGNAHIIPMQPPEPPAITTMPRTPRPDHSMKIGLQSMIASALNSSARSPMSENLPPNFSRPNHTEREINVANRPPLPLPPQGHPHNDTFSEVYEEMEYEENTYEAPPVINPMPPRLPMPPKKVPTGNLVNVKENTLKSRPGNRPAVTPKPLRSGTNAVIPANELEQTLRRRNADAISKPNPGHIMQPEQAVRRNPNTDAQTKELEEALRRRHNEPPPTVKKLKGQPVRHPVQEEIYYNENQGSSDEEWTYEPLKPFNSYDTNIYNI